ncbi:RNA polymerase II subunit A C-terminal domain phosphatase-like [Polyodon spathula]|uniref:RNA polymerase II subunit A C-terminal domain phosphatase-like n=1 Tax=Polyodon spathula TaxID=7913 RepID=UPI001B7DAF0D|nr:RNA polymerase II subunit A C-terminal domain phosphatase-like [Polyodon spathula]XP_041104484.1 RNA polymerase II subunit A C-terminal domain phosphatase-like [Polyodon spathula]
MEDPADSGGGGTAASAGPSMLVTEIHCSAGARPLRLLEWKVKPGSHVNIDSVLAVCIPISLERQAGEEPQDPPSGQAKKKVKSDRAGVVRELCCQPGQVISPGGILVRIEECTHPVVMKGLCAECGQDLTQLQTPISTANVSMVHSIPELMVSSEQAEQLGREDQHRLYRNRKLVLMVDLDQTLIHTTEQHCKQMSNKGIFHFQLGRGEPMLHTRLRPHCKDFLEKIAKLYELHVFTFGSRLYAHTIAGFLDPEKKLFSHRILSRDECIDPFSKTGNLRNLFPCGDSMVCIIDDREDVWKFAPNLITVKKYVYFQGTGDINAPPGSKEAQMRKKANNVNKPNEVSEPASSAQESLEEVKVSAVEEQSNGLRKRGKERNGTKNTSADDSSSKSTAANSQDRANERIHSGGEYSSAADASGVYNSSSTEQDSGRTVTDKRSVKSSGDSVANDFDFDLSSDSESEHDSGAEKASSNSDSEGKNKRAKKSESMQPDQNKSKINTVGENHSGEKQVDPEDQVCDIKLDNEQGSLGGLGNGCREKKEAETESQNSEQSGLTIGESLDQSMEEEEEEEDLDKDDHLIYLEEVLTRIHMEYYARYDKYLKKELPEAPDIRKIVPELKSKGLAGTIIVFSGLYPTSYPMERTRECYHAVALGAKISKHLVLNAKDPNRTTHLIAARPGTEKVRQAQGYKHLHIVNPDWLWGCLERWERVEEQLFPLKEDYIKTQRTNSPATFPDIESAFQTPLFHPTPIHPKVEAGPEVRIYDPVTGKLIRKGPQSSRQSPYIQSPAPPITLPVHGEQSSFRVVQPHQHLGEEELQCSRLDDEQPGPSRRERQPSMSESMPLYTLCKEDLESMDKEVDDILGEESDNESEEKTEEEEAGKNLPEGQNPGTVGTTVEEKPTTSSSKEGNLTDSTPRGHKRKLEEAGDRDGNSSGESSKESSNEDEEGSSSEADEMAAALEAELNDFI